MGRKKGMGITQVSQAWKALLVGQEHAIDKITPYIVRAQAKLNAPGRPIGVFFLMGPTGTGKTRTAETLAEVLHGSEKNVLRVDCGEFQMDHEVAKLIGAPPGYLGHRETHPIFTQQKLNAMSSDKCDMQIVLFDEIEKASPGVWRAILGILDKAVLRLGDNSSTDFSKAIIFLSSNIGAKEISELLEPSFGFTVDTSTDIKEKNIEKISRNAMFRKFPPEFANRVDEIITYKSLTFDALSKITEMELAKLQNHLNTQMGAQSFWFTYDADTLAFLTTAGTSVKYGARELKRILGRYILNPLADDFVEGRIASGSTVHCRVVSDHIEWDVTEPPEEDPAITVDAVEVEPEQTPDNGGSGPKKRRVKTSTSEKS
jgi:ATP-dependent Clp protease ATP-binding subunit ClpA